MLDPIPDLYTVDIVQLRLQQKLQGYVRETPMPYGGSTHEYFPCVQYVYTIS